MILCLAICRHEPISLQGVPPNIQQIILFKQIQGPAENMQLLISSHLDSHYLIVATYFALKPCFAIFNNEQKFLWSAYIHTKFVILYLTVSVHISRRRHGNTSCSSSANVRLSALHKKRPKRARQSFVRLRPLHTAASCLPSVLIVETYCPFYCSRYLKKYVPCAPAEMSPTWVGVTF
jgi:hypothetical protein